MKIIAINGSPKGKASNTNVMVSAFLNGAQKAGAETINIFLSEKEIEYCRGCHTCWTKGPGQCVISDDMTGVLMLMGGADVIIFASPVYFVNISGMLKTFMDRMTMIGGPHPQKDLKAAGKSAEPPVGKAPKLMMISNCGLPDRTEFDVISLWIKRIAKKMNMPLIGEIYATQGKYLTDSSEELRPIIINYLRLLEKAGEEIVADMQISEATANLLEKANRGFGIVPQ